jgi:hypothetical protein
VEPTWRFYMLFSGAIDTGVESWHFFENCNVFVAVTKSCWLNLIRNMGTARIAYFGLVYACGVECGRITNLCQRYLCVCDKIQTLSVRFFQVLVDSSLAEKNALWTGSQYCVTSSPVSELHSIRRKCGGKDICFVELFPTVVIIYVSLFCSAVSLVQ